MRHAREHPYSTPNTLKMFSVFHALRAFGEWVSNCRELEEGPWKPSLLVFPYWVKQGWWSEFSLNEQRRSLCHSTESDCSAGLLLTSAGTRRLLARCWLKERHQASVYPFMLGTYFFIVSSFSLSHTPSSLWIYGKTSNRAEHSHALLLLWKQEGQIPHTDQLWGCRRDPSPIKGPERGVTEER